MQHEKVLALRSIVAKLPAAFGLGSCPELVIADEFAEGLPRLLREAELLASRRGDASSLRSPDPPWTPAVSVGVAEEVVGR